MQLLERINCPKNLTLQFFFASLKSRRTSQLNIPTKTLIKWKLEFTPSIKNIQVNKTVQGYELIYKTDKIFLSFN